MDVKITDTKQAGERPYPKLMISERGRVVLFTSKTQGAALNTDSGTPGGEGYFSKNWEESNFEDLEGSITLSND